MRSNIQKLKKLLWDNGYIIMEYYVLEGLCRYIKIIHTYSGQIFLLFIPSRFNLAVEYDSNVFTLALIEEKEEVENHHAPQTYVPIGSHSPTEMRTDISVAEQLENNYVYNITLSQLRPEEMNLILGLKLQTQRLRHCFKFMKHKICLQASNFLSVLLDDDTIHNFNINGYDKETKRVWFVVTELETFYLKIDNFSETLQVVGKELAGLLDKNQQKHLDFLQKKYVDDFVRKSVDIFSKKIKLNAQQQSIQAILSKIQRTEEQLVSQKEALQTEKGQTRIDDTSIAAKRNHLEKNLTKVHQTKLEVLKNLQTHDTILKNLYLRIDQLGFDLSVALNEMRIAMTEL
jgi:hypothetical protein